MLDLTLALNDLKHVREAHIVSVGNECKELLLLLGQGEGVPADDIPIHCVNFTGVPAPQALVFTRRQEKERACPYTPQLKSYLYEPNASVLKAGAFRSLSSLYKVENCIPTATSTPRTTSCRTSPAASSGLPPPAASARKK